MRLMYAILAVMILHCATHASGVSFGVAGGDLALGGPGACGGIDVRVLAKHSAQRPRDDIAVTENDEDRGDMVWQRVYLVA